MTARQGPSPGTDSPSTSAISNTNHAFRPAWRSPLAWCLLAIMTLGGLGLDLGTKAWSFHSVTTTPVQIDRQRVIEDPTYDPITDQPPYGIILVPGRILNLQLVLNPGAVFGIGAHRRGFFITFTILAVLVCLWIFTRWMSHRSWMAHIGIGLVLAGALGNLYDRLVFGRVRDFLLLFPDRHLPFGWSWPGSGKSDLFPWVFNIADVMLLTGMGLLLLHLHLADRAQRRSKKAAGKAMTDAG